MIRMRMLKTMLGAGAAACLATAAMGQSLADIEAANEQLVLSFLAGAGTGLDHLRTYLAEDVTFQYEDTRVDGLDALIARSAPKMTGLGSYAMEPVRTFVVGNTVLNDRVDVATLADGQEIRLNVTSVFLIEDGKIREWREYPKPEAAP